jgi:hypothetical protein
MKNLCFVCFCVLAASLNFACQSAQDNKHQAELKPYVEERVAKLGRGLVVLSTDSGIFLTWRKLPDDTDRTTYDVYRRETSGIKKISTELTKTPLTCFIDGNIQPGHTYAYSIGSFHEEDPSGQVEVVGVSDAEYSPRIQISPEVTITVPANNVMLHGNTAASRYMANGSAPYKTHAKMEQNGLSGRSESGNQKVGAAIFDLGMEYGHVQLTTGDLTGDGELEVLIKHTNNWDVDPWDQAWEPSKDTYKVSAYKANGELLWRIDLGWGIEAGVFYSPIVVWDIDGDGRSEILLKTNKSSDPKEYDSEYISVLEGASGEVINEARWPSTEGFRKQDYNSNSRNYIAVAHLDGENPYIITARGLYKDQKIVAYDNKLQKVWERIINDGSHGLHSLPIADIDDDGKEEIMWGEHCIGEDGKDLWAIEDRMPYRGHPDICFVADILPSHPGKEVFYCREGWHKTQHKDIGLLLADSKGKIIWAHWNYRHVDGGWVSRVIPGESGMQCYSYDISGKKINAEGIGVASIDQYLWSSDGDLLAEPDDMWMSFPVDWDGDGLREVCLRNGTVKRFGGPVVAKLDSGAVWGGDIFGDHREEIVVAPMDGKVYVYFNTDLLRSLPRVTLLDDRKYKNDLSRTAMQMNMVPLEGGQLTSAILRNSKNGSDD